ncbi:MAG: VTT domain-containing protein [Planctomycetota bacterium]
MEFLDSVRQLLHDLVHVESLRGSVQASWPWFFLTMCAIIFCETGLVFLPFLPGDSLLFAIGALAATVPEIGFHWILAGLFLAAVLGDAFNYLVGSWFGPKIFSIERSRILNPSHLRKAKLFFDKNGPKTIVLARFVPIIRTFAPFVAGAGGMNYQKFALFNVVGAGLWVLGCAGAGYLFGNIPFVKTNFELVVLGIVGVSILPFLSEMIRPRFSPSEIATDSPSKNGKSSELRATPPAA